MAEKPTWMDRIRSLAQGLRAKPWISRLLLALSILYILLLLYLSRSEIQNIDWGSFGARFAICAGLYYLSMLLQNLNWSLIVDQNTRGLRENSEIYFNTLLMKRLPGGFWHWLGRSNMYAEKEKTPANNLVKSNLIEWLSLILTGLCCYVATLTIWGGIAILVLSAGVILRLGRNPSRSNLQSLPRVFLMLGLYLACWLLGARIMDILLDGIIAPQTSPFLLSIKTWSLSGSVATFVFFLPNGALIREFTLTALLTPYYDLPKVVMLALQIRLVFTLSEVVFSLLSLQLIRLSQRLTDRPKAS